MFRGFNSNLWHLYVKTGLSPMLLKKQVDELYYFHSQNNSLGSGVSIFQVCNNISDLKAVQASLDCEVVGLKSTKSELEKSNAELIVRNSKVAVEIGANVEFRDKLRANGHQNGEILDSVDLAMSVKKSGYTIEEAIEKFSDFARLDREKATIHQEIRHQEVRRNFLLKWNLDFEELISAKSQTIQEIKNVKELGFGLQELKLLRRKLDEVDEQAGESAGAKASVERFFRFFDEYYCDYYNLSDKVKELQSNITESTEKLDYMSMAFGLTPDIGMMIYSLARKGINRFDIPDLVKKIEEKHHASHSISFKIDTTTSDRDSAGFKKPPLVSEESNPRTSNDGGRISVMLSLKQI